MRYSLVLFLVVFAIRAWAQSLYSTNPDSATLFPTRHGTFENYAFVLNGKVIEQHALPDNPGAKLNNVFPYAIKLEGNSYRGAVYFHTQERYAPPVRYANEPAYFINGRQVSPNNFRLSKVEAYNRIDKSARDTTVNGKLYRGSIHVDTDEDFFAERIALPELIEQHTGLSPEQVIVHWRSSGYRYTYEDDLGIIIQDHFPMYSFNTGRFGIKAVEVDRIRFAEGDRYVVHIVDNMYKWSSSKTRLIFEDPLAVDTIFPCYVKNIDLSGSAVFTRTEVMAEPYQGMVTYLKKLSVAMGLPATEKPQGTAIVDSITVKFMVLESGMLAALESPDHAKPGNQALLNAIKKLACVWMPALQGSRPVKSFRKMAIFYTKNKEGNIQSLDRLEYRYDNLPTKKFAQ